MIQHLVIEKPDKYLCAMTNGNGLAVIKVFTKHYTEWVVKQDSLICKNEPEVLMLKNLLKSGII